MSTSTVLLKNIGTIVSGDIENPVLSGDAIYIEDGKIANVGALADFGDSFLISSKLSAVTLCDCQ